MYSGKIRVLEFAHDDFRSHPDFMFYYFVSMTEIGSHYCGTMLRTKRY